MSDLASLQSSSKKGIGPRVCSGDVFRVRESSRYVVQEIVHAWVVLVFLSRLRLHPSLNEKALLLGSVQWHTIQARRLRI